MGLFTPSQQSKILSDIPHYTGLFSLFGSSYIIITILKDRKKKWSKPYYRLLFAMCVFDVFSSVALGLSTWPIPVDSAGVYEPKGNVGTCAAQAFFIQANIASPIYNFMLSVQFLLRVKYGWSEKRIGQRAEPIMHFATIAFGVGTSFLCLGLELFNDSTLWCWVNASPKGCSQSYKNGDGVETDCERGDNAEIYRWAIFFGPLWACIVGCMVVMAMIFLTVRAQENKMKNYQFSSAVSASVHSRRQSASDIHDAQLERKRKEDERRQHKQSRQVAFQALRFVGVFYLTWAFATVNRLLQLIVGHSYFWLMFLHTIFVPMQGFFNFLVYIYPRSNEIIAVVSTPVEAAKRFSRRVSQTRLLGMNHIDFESSVSDDEEDNNNNNNNNPPTIKVINNNRTHYKKGGDLEKGIEEEKTGEEDCDDGSYESERQFEGEEQPRTIVTLDR